MEPTCAAGRRRPRAACEPGLLEFFPPTNAVGGTPPVVLDTAVWPSLVALVVGLSFFSWCCWSPARDLPTHARTRTCGAAAAAGRSCWLHRAGPGTCLLVAAVDGYVCALALRWRLLRLCGPYPCASNKGVHAACVCLLQFASLLSVQFSSFVCRCLHSCTYYSLPTFLHVARERCAAAPTGRPLPVYQLPFLSSHTHFVRQRQHLDARLGRWCLPLAAPQARRRQAGRQAFCSSGEPWQSAFVFTCSLSVIVWH